MNSGELRFIVTSKCNYACGFCHKEGQFKVSKELMTEYDYEFLFSVYKERFENCTSTITGGEPLVHKDIINIAEKLYFAGSEITLVTNGYYLYENILIGNYIKKLNISFHTMDSVVYSKIVGKSDKLHKVILGLKWFKKMYPDTEICLNVAIVEGVNDSKEEFLKILEFAQSINANVKAIQLFPEGCENYVTIEKIRQIILNEGYTKILSFTRKENYSNGRHTVGLTKIFCAVAALKENPSDYCFKNNDLFISSEGKVEYCREKKSEIDWLQCIKERDKEGLISKLEELYSVLGTECLYQK